MRELSSLFFRGATVPLGLLMALLAIEIPAMADPAGGAPASNTAVPWGAPGALVLSDDESKAYVAYTQTERVDEIDPDSRKVARSFKVPGSPLGLALHGSDLFVTCSGAASPLCRVDLASGKLKTVGRTGHTAVSPVFSPDGRTLYFCLRFENQVVVWDVSNNRERRRIKVGREPVSVACTADGAYLLVSHHLPAGAATASVVAATIGVVDLQSGSMISEVALPNGSGLVRDIRISPDGRHAAVAHNLAHYQLPTTQLDRGWMNTAAVSILDLGPRGGVASVSSTTTASAAQPVVLEVTCVLDEMDKGAANPWAVGWSRDGQHLFVTHAGTHELSRINFTGLLEKMARMKAGTGWDPILPAEDFSFLLGLRERIPLAGRGPRSLAVGRTRVCIADYFSDMVESVGIAPGALAAVIKAPIREPFGKFRAGEQYFNDATYCFQGWQSCASCHSEQARVDGLNWDLLNDGIGNPKNSKTLLWSHRTPPAMSMGVRISAEVAVRAGIRHILFAIPDEAVARPMDAWLGSLEPVPSPMLVRGGLSAAARRGRDVFNRPLVGCAGCHKPGLFTDLQTYDVGTGTGGASGAQVLGFDTPTLVELWRTAPYLHDGSAADLRSVLTTHNVEDRHGHTSRLAEQELNDLIEYLLSL